MATTNIECRDYSKSPKKDTRFCHAAKLKVSVFVLREESRAPPTFVKVNGMISLPILVQNF